MAFAICTISGKQAEHRFDAVATFQTTGGVAVGSSGDFRIVLTVGGKAHDVVPVKIPQLRQMVAVKAGVVGEDRLDTVMLEPDSKICNSLGLCAENGIHWCLNE